MSSLLRGYGKKVYKHSDVGTHIYHLNMSFNPSDYELQAVDTLLRDAEHDTLTQAFNGWADEDNFSDDAVDETKGVVKRIFGIDDDAALSGVLWADGLTFQYTDCSNPWCFFVRVDENNDVSLYKIRIANAGILTPCCDDITFLEMAEICNL